MPITCTRKFSWPRAGTEGEADIYFPGQEIKEADAAAFAKLAGYAEEKGDQLPSTIVPRHSPENANATLKKSGGETKAEKKAREKAEREAERAARGVQPDEGEIDAVDQGGEG